MHQRLRDFFEGATLSISAAFRATRTMSRTSSGSIRERAVLGVIKTILPPTVTMLSGDVIDVDGRRTGQLDGVVVHSFAPTLALANGDGRIIMAEGVTMA